MSYAIPIIYLKCLPGAFTASRRAPRINTGKPFIDRPNIYIWFLKICDEKQATIKYLAKELASVVMPSRAKAFRLFDAGMGDAAILTGVAEEAQKRFGALPHYVVAKEHSFVDVELAMPKLFDRLVAHPPTAFAVTNLRFKKAPWLPDTLPGKEVIWNTIALEGNTPEQWAAQMEERKAALAEDWGLQDKKHMVLVFYRKDEAERSETFRNLIPQPGKAEAGFNFIVASQPYRLIKELEFKAKRVLAPLVDSLAPGGRMIGIQSNGWGNLHRITRYVWKGEHFFRHTARQVLDAVRQEFTGREDLNFRLAKSFVCRLHPNNDRDAWMAATYIAQIEDGEVRRAEEDGLDLRAVNRARPWFRKPFKYRNQPFVITRAAEPA